MRKRREPSETRKLPEIDRVHEILGRVMRRICPNWLSAQREDLVQDAVLRIARRVQKDKESEPLGTSYLWRVAHSVVMDEIRRRRRHPEVDLENPGIPVLQSPRGNPDESRSRAELRAAINEGLGALKEPHRWAVLLYLYGFSLKDSAAMLGWTTKRVDNQRYQGLAALRAYLRRSGIES